jgi:hypothetical protein
MKNPKIETIKATIIKNLKEKTTRKDLLKALEDSYCFVYANAKEDAKLIKTIEGF